MTEVLERHEPSLGRKVSVAWDFAKGIALHPERRAGVLKVITGKGAENHYLGCSVEVTRNCNLDCQCYMNENGRLLTPNGQERRPIIDLSSLSQFNSNEDPSVINARATALKKQQDQEWLAKYEQCLAEHPSIVHADLIGGEPLTDAEKAIEAARLTFSSWMTSNGTRPIKGNFPPRCAVAVSIDGPKEIHDQLRPYWTPNPVTPAQRAKMSSFDKALKNINDADCPTFVHTVITRQNWQQMPALFAQLREEARYTNGVAVSIFSAGQDVSRPSHISEEDEPYCPVGEERDQVVDMLQEQKKLHGRFLMMSPTQIDMFRPANMSKYFADQCKLPKNVLSLDYDFKPLAPCVMGSPVGTEGVRTCDCDNCGCTINNAIWAVAKFDVQGMMSTLRTFF